ncbi:MAG: ROK family transcriptional regulator [Spirochaetia bacterium]|nr:ROK family transcriptional regulator [Spirochaetia bacterium]
MNFTQITDVRQINRLRILNLIAKSEKTSRASIARELGFNKVSTGEIVDILIKEGLVEELGAQITQSGRPSIGLSLNKEKYFVIAIDIGLRNIRFALMNLSGELLRFERFPTPITPTVEEAMALMIRHINAYKGRLAKEQVLKGIGISIGADVESSTGTIIEHRDWKWKNIPLSYAIEKYTNIPVVVENNVVAMIKGEKWFNEKADKERIFFINWGEHISGAFVAPGRKISPEALFGHLIVTEKNKCSCGGIGCLETVASGKALAAHATKSKSVKSLVEEANDEPHLQRLLYESVAYMAKALINTAAIVRPTTIIIGGGISLLPEPYFNHLIQVFNTHCPPIVNNNITITRSVLKERGGIIGTGVVALDEFIFRRSTIEQLAIQ